MGIVSPQAGNWHVLAHGFISFYGVSLQATYLSPVLPIVSTQAVSAIGSTTAAGKGTITLPGIPNPTQHGVCWNTVGSPTTDGSFTQEGTVAAVGPFVSPITGL